MSFVVCIGECMLEVSGNRVPGPAQLAFGGDAFNTALYLARLGAAPEFLTALGTDPYSSEMLECWRAEGVRTDLVVVTAGRLPGVYAIRTASGERSFCYWRSESAARTLFQSSQCEPLLERAGDADLLYLSGISLSLFARSPRARLRRLAARVRDRGGTVAFDPNFRSRCWTSPAAARTALEELAPFITLVLPTLEDERELWGDETAASAVARWRAFGVREGVIKRGAEAALVFTADGDFEAPAATPFRVIDTTAAGDAFNAGYLARRLRGDAPREAARFAHRLAAIVVQYPGAIAPREAMSALLAECADR
jgi:2-dehydro-3-deoxygluconokinase